MSHRFSFLRWPLAPLKKQVGSIPFPSKLNEHLAEADYSVRLLRYWWAGQALAEEALRLGRPLRVVDLGCERGWLKHFTPAGAVAHWTGVDWNPNPEAQQAGYDELVKANADAVIPLPSATADVVVSLHLFEHLPRPAATLAEVSRLLAPGGVFLGGAPTMPGILARLRERYFRRRFSQGRIVPGGHISCLSPGRWRWLAKEMGLEVEFAVGSHAVRMTGSFLENSKLWVRLNQFWGALFPSLGSECYVRARRQQAWDFQAQPLAHGRARPRWLWATAATAALVLMGFGVLNFPALGDNHACPLDRWLASHQEGGDRFVVLAHENIPAHIAKRRDVTLVETLDHLKGHSESQTQAHLLVEKRHLAQLASADLDLSVDSRLSLGEADYYLLRNASNTGSPLRHYLYGM